MAGLQLPGEARLPSEVHRRRPPAGIRRRLELPGGHADENATEHAGRGGGLPAGGPRKHATEDNKTNTEGSEINGGQSTFNKIATERRRDKLRQGARDDRSRPDGPARENREAGKADPAREAEHARAEHKHLKALERLREALRGHEGGEQDSCRNGPREEEMTFLTLSHISINVADSRVIL